MQKKQWEGNLSAAFAAKRAVLDDGKGQLFYLFRQMVILFKIWVVSRVILYMVVSIPIHLWRDLRKQEPKNPLGPITLVHWANSCLRYAGVDIKPQNHEVLSTIDWERNVFFVSNHQSYFDIPTVIAGSEKTVGFIAKYELTRFPLLAYWMKKFGCVAINRKEYTSAIRKLKALTSRGKPSHLVIFPEGTRSKTGKLGKLKPGGIKIAWQLNAILVPTTIRGTRQMWESRTKDTRVNTLSITFGEPIDLEIQGESKKFSEFFKEFEKKFIAMTS